ncbi:MAG: hypothetical protein JOZ69_12200 [Myxococcales bacterium]|nr:hypothetical protein [Myxococcales bacterium]
MRQLASAPYPQKFFATVADAALFFEPELGPAVLCDRDPRRASLPAPCPARLDPILRRGSHGRGRRRDRRGGRRPCRKAIVDIPTAALALAALGGVWRLKRFPEPLWIALAGLLGVAIHGAARAQ